MSIWMTQCIVMESKHIIYVVCSGCVSGTPLIWDLEFECGVDGEVGEFVPFQISRERCVRAYDMKVNDVCHPKWCRSEVAKVLLAPRYRQSHRHRLRDIRHTIRHTTRYRLKMAEHRAHRGGLSG